MKLEGFLLEKFQVFVDNLNIGCDKATDAFIEKTYMKVTLASGMYCSLDRDKLLNCTFYIFVLILHSALLLWVWSLLTLSAIELYKISTIISLYEIHLLSLTMLALLALWNSWNKRQNVARLHRIMSQNFFDYEEDLSETMAILEAAMSSERRKYIIFVFLIGFGCTAAILIGPMLNMRFGSFIYNTTLDSVNFDLALPAAYPFNPSDGTGFYFVYALELATAFSVAIILSNNCFMIVHSLLIIALHLKLLVLQFKNIEARAVKLCGQLYGVQPARKISRDERFTKCLKICLKKNIQHHQIIITAMSDANTIYSFSVAFFYLIAAVNIATSVLSTSSINEFPGTTFSSVTMCFVEISFVALFAHLGQKITDLSSDLREEIYNMPWYYYDKSVTRTIQILLLVTLEPLTFSFHNLLYINYDSFAKVMHSAYSYYSVVNAYM